MIGMLHAGGWDEVLLLGVALIVGFGIVMLSGKKKPAAQDTPEPPTPEEAAPIARALQGVRDPRVADDTAVPPSDPRLEGDATGRLRADPVDGDDPARSRDDARAPSDSRITPAQ